MSDASNTPGERRGPRGAAKRTKKQVRRWGKNVYDYGGLGHAGPSAKDMVSLAREGIEGWKSLPSQYRAGRPVISRKVDRALGVPTFKGKTRKRVKK